MSKAFSPVFCVAIGENWLLQIPKEREVLTLLFPEWPPKKKHTQVWELWDTSSWVLPISEHRFWLFERKSRWKWWRMGKFCKMVGSLFFLLSRFDRSEQLCLDWVVCGVLARWWGRFLFFGLYSGSIGRSNISTSGPKTMCDPIPNAMPVTLKFENWHAWLFCWCVTRLQRWKAWHTCVCVHFVVILVGTCSIN